MPIPPQSYREDDAVNKLTGRYDAESGAYLRYWAPVLEPPSRALVAALPAVTASRVLDVGAGAGTLLPILQRRFEGATIFAVDRSDGMLSHADDRYPQAVMDATAQAIRSRALDIVTMAFMLFHVPQPVEALRESHRVLRAGGTVGVTTWAEDIQSTAVSIWNDTLDAHGATPADALGRLAQHELMDSVEKVTGLLKTAGFVSVDAKVEEFFYAMEPDDFVSLRLSVGSSKQRVDGLDAKNRRRFLNDVQTRLARLTAADMNMSMKIVIAVANTND